MVFPLILGGAAAFGLGSFLGRGSGGSAPILSQNELFTKKSQSTVTNTRTNTVTSSFTDARSVSIITGSPNASITTKKDIETAQTPSIAVTPLVSPIQGSGSGLGGGSGSASPFDNLGNILIIGGIVGGGLLFLNSFLKKKK